MIGFTLILSRLLTAISTLLGVLLSISVPTYAAISTCEESIQKTVRIGIEETLDPEFFVENDGADDGSPASCLSQCCIQNRNPVDGSTL